MLKMSVCVLCRIDIVDETRLGKVLQKSDISVHHHCLFLTNGLLQNGQCDNSGLLGFLLKDIRQIAAKASYYKCRYCGKPQANIKCWDKKCGRRFHFSCGLENSCNSHFTKYFESYCHLHVKIKKDKHPEEDELCNICYSEIGKCQPVESILAPCCKSGWFHKWCIAKFALTAGYFFKCPLCNNSEEFRDGMKHRGIFVPDQDAAWELETGAYHELLERPDTCSAEYCDCSNGRKYDKGRYKLIYCVLCGSKAIHLRCLMGKSTEYTCADCQKLSVQIIDCEETSVLSSGENFNSVENETAGISIREDIQDEHMPIKKLKRTVGKAIYDLDITSELVTETRKIKLNSENEQHSGNDEKVRKNDENFAVGTTNNVENIFNNKTCEDICSLRTRFNKYHRPYSFSLKLNLTQRSHHQEIINTDDKIERVTGTRNIESERNNNKLSSDSIYLTNSDSPHTSNVNSTMRRRGRPRKSNEDESNRSGADITEIKENHNQKIFLGNITIYSRGHNLRKRKRTSTMLQNLFNHNTRYKTSKETSNINNIGSSKSNFRYD